jgi:hypothetical protein
MTAEAAARLNARGMVLRCPGCACRVGRGHLPTCEYVRDFEAWFMAAAGLHAPREGGGLKPWLERIK